MLRVIHYGLNPRKQLALGAQQSIPALATTTTMEPTLEFYVTGHGSIVHRKLITTTVNITRR